MGKDVAVVLSNFDNIFKSHEVRYRLVGQGSAYAIQMLARLASHGDEVCLDTAVRACDVVGGQLVKEILGTGEEICTQFESMADDPRYSYAHEMRGLTTDLMGELLAKFARMDEIDTDDISSERVGFQGVVGSLVKTGLMMRAMAEGETLESLMGPDFDQVKRGTMEFGQSQLEGILSLLADHPDLPIHNSVEVSEYLMRGIYDQFELGITPEEAREWVDTLYKRLGRRNISTSIHDDKELVAQYTDQDRAGTMLRNAVSKMMERGELPKTGLKVLILGPGSGKVEESALKDLPEDTIFVGVDPELQASSWKRMRLEQMTFTEYAKTHKGEKYDLIISIGSGPHNNYSLAEWLELMKSMNDLSGESTKVIMEAGAIDPNPSQNKRTKMASKYNSENHLMLWGIYPPLPVHRENESVPEDRPGVVMYDSAMYLAMVIVAGAKILNMSRIVDGSLLPKWEDSEYISSLSNDLCCL